MAVQPKTILTKPGLEARLFKAYSELGESNELLDIAQKICIEEGEWLFEQEVKDHPFGMEIKELGHGFPDDELLAWCHKHFQKSDFIIMPINAMGKYAHMWNWIFFKTKDQLLLCKLTWC